MVEERIPLRVLHIHNYYRLPGGEDASSDAEVAMLRRAGHDVRTIRAHNPDRTVPALTALAASPSNPAQARAMRQKVREWRPDVAHIHNTWFVLTPAIVHALHRESVPIVMTLHNYRLVCVSANLLRDGRVCTDCVGTHPWWGAMHRCYRDSLPASMLAATTIAFNRARRTWDLVDRFVAPSGFVRDLFIEAGFRHDRLVVKPNVANDPGPRPLKPSASRTVLFAGRLSREKGVGTLLDAWFRASLDLELVVAGDGPLRVELERAAPPGVRFEGWVDSHRLTGMMLDARALVVPSEWLEIFGQVIVEAFAAGLPVLASDLAAPAELVAELGSRWLAPPGESAGWARALAAIEDDRAVDAAGTRARELFESKYCFEAVLPRLLDIYAAARAERAG